MHNNIDEITRKIAEKSRDLADIFDRIARSLSEVIGEYDKEIYHEPSLSKDILKDFPKRTGRIIDEIASIYPINQIPSDMNDDCRPICIVKALEKWTTSKGFQASANELIALWLRCESINKDNLIFTFAWDELEFIKNFKRTFDFYSKKGKTICVVLVTLNGFSIQYLR
jgi:hypothetical protein